MKKEIHKWVDCKDGWMAEIYLKYDSKTYEVLSESVIFSNEKVDYSKPQASELPLKYDLCPNCNGEGIYTDFNDEGVRQSIRCMKCKGTGRL